MPARVVIVKRSRRRSFALLSAVPGWVRSAWSAVRRTRSSNGTGGGERVPDLPRDVGVPHLRSVGTSAPLTHACTACGICVEVCPSTSLRLEARSPEPRASNGDASPVELRRFSLDLGRCVGCGRCAEVCPEEALGLERMPSVALVGRSGRPLPVDLLESCGAAAGQAGS